MKDFIPLSVIARMSKTGFLIHYDVPKPILRRVVLKSIRNDYWFIFDRLLKKYYESWKRVRRYRYNGKVYKHFVEFLWYRVVDNQSIACKMILYKKFSNEYKWM